MNSDCKSCGNELCDDCGECTNEYCELSNPEHAAHDGATTDAERSYGAKQVRN